MGPTCQPAPNSFHAFPDVHESYEASTPLQRWSSANFPSAHGILGSQAVSGGLPAEMWLTLPERERTQ